MAPPLRFGLAVVAAEAIIHIGGGGKFIHDVACGDFDFEGVCVALRPLKFHRILPGFLGFQKTGGFDADDPGANQEQIAGKFAVINSVEGPVITKRQRVLLQILTVALVI